MALAKTSKSKKESRAEKIGEVSGRRRVYLGAALLIFAAVFFVAMSCYDPSQQTFFTDAAHTNTTSEPTHNLCGRAGATFCNIFINIFGVGTWLILAYAAFVGVLCFLRRQRLVRAAPLFAMVSAVVLLSVLATFIQDAMYGHDDISEYFPSTWGGKVGNFLFLKLAYPALDYFGSGVVLTILYAFALIASFTESPLELIKETAVLFAKICALLWRGAKAACRGIASVFSRRAEAEDDPEPKPAKKKPRSKKATADAEASDDADDSDDIFDAELEDEDITLHIPEPEEDEPAEEPEAEEDSAEEEPAEAESEEDAAESEESEEEPEEIDDDAEEEPAPAATISEVLGTAAKRPLSEVGEALERSAPAEKDAAAPAAKGLKVSVLEEEKYEAPKQSQKKGDYVFPSIDLLFPPKKKDDSQVEDYEARMQQIINTFDEFKIGVTPSEAFAGPVITRYEVKPNSGVRVSKIINMEDDLAIGLKVAHVRVAPTSRGTVGIEVPNKIRQNVCMREIIESKEWNESKAAIPVVLGKDVSGKPVVLDLAKMPHALIAGSTGSGKSVCINVIVASLLYKCTPEDLRFVMVDPKVVELQVYNALPHMLVPVVTDPKKVPTALNWLVKEMMKRYKIFEKAGVKNIIGFNGKILKDKEEQARARELEAMQTPEERAMSLNAIENDVSEDDGGEIEIPKKKMPYIVCIIDELADLMQVAGKEVEGAIGRLTQLARAAGIHLLVATQRPSVDVVTGLIKSNLPTRIGFRVASTVDSRTILDAKGAETLIGWGDMLFVPPGSSDLIRAQGAYLDDAEINSLVDAVAQNGEPEFESAMQDELEAAGDDAFGIEGEWSDELAPQAWKVIKEGKRASTSYIQRKLRIGYNRAARVMDELEEKGFIGPDNGPSAPREILK